MNLRSTDESSSVPAASPSWVLWTSDEWQGQVAEGTGLGEPALTFPGMGGSAAAAAVGFERRVTPAPCVPNWHVGLFRPVRQESLCSRADEGPDGVWVASA